MALSNGTAALIAVGIVGAASALGLLIVAANEGRRSSAREENPKRLGSGGSEVQTLIFQKGTFTKSQAKRWAIDHGYKASKVDEEPDAWRLRQHPPSRYVRIRTRDFSPSIRANIGFLK